MQTPLLFSLSSPKKILRATGHLQDIVSELQVEQAISESTLTVFKNWLFQYPELSDKAPFSELIETLQASFQKGSLTREDLLNIQWLKASLTHTTLDAEDLSFLKGLLSRINGESLLLPDDMGRLRDWLNARNYLEGVWPYAELLSTLRSFKYVDHIPEAQIEALKDYLNDFLSAQDSQNVLALKRVESSPVKGLCSLGGDIYFKGKNFCLAGECRKNPRHDLIEKIQSEGGNVSYDLDAATDYLIICAEATPAWKYASYGNKVARALEYKKLGSPLQIILEDHLWNASEKAA